MTILDAHTHLYSRELAPPFWLNSMVRYGASVSGRTEEYVQNRIEKDWFDVSGDLLVSDMDEAGIEKSVVFAMDMGLSGGVDDDISLVQRYELFAKAVTRHSDRLVLFGGIDPRRPDAAKFVERAVKEWNIKGVKIWPPAGVIPNAPYCYRVYEKCAQLGLPVVVHTGQEIGPLHSQSARPIFVDQPAADFPEVTFVLAHAGMAWWEEAADMAWHQPNVYVDIAYWQGKFLKNSEVFFKQLQGLISIAHARKVIFGSDWPALRNVPRVRPKEWVEVLMGLSESQDGAVPVLKETERDLLVAGAAQKAYAL
jgi:predicted TIM-barrel fold metal-dependent hydrolase